MICRYAAQNPDADRPGLPFTAILMMALGIGANVALFTPGSFCSDEAASVSVSQEQLM